MCAIRAALLVLTISVTVSLAGDPCGKFFFATCIYQCLTTYMYFVIFYKRIAPGQCVNSKMEIDDKCVNKYLTDEKLLTQKNTIQSFFVHLQSKRQSVTHCQYSVFKLCGLF